uniref:Uncharacterized protein n=1 Tax=Caenorhabditis japonica TaxID=281687 RepID=A0A8R1HNW6_CAEJA
MNDEKSDSDSDNNANCFDQSAIFLIYITLFKYVRLFALKDLRSAFFILFSAILRLQGSSARGYLLLGDYVLSAPSSFLQSLP